MNKMDKDSLNLEKLNVEKIKELFPNVVTEGKIDFDKLRVMLGDEIDDRVEKYQFTWNGKSSTIKLAQSPSTGTLIPSKEDSKNWDATGNLYIEGDNLEVLKQLQKTYYGKIKMIYIDPPYNTGGDFVYKDDFKDNIKNYKEQTQQTSRANPETNGRYHTDWLNMMYSRLLLAKNLLSNDGIIYVHIGSDELTNLSKICDEIFGEFNNITIFSRLMKSGGGKGKNISPNMDYILTYSKNINMINKFVAPISEKLLNSYYNKIEEHGVNAGRTYAEERIFVSGLDVRPNQRYWIKCPDGSYVIPNGSTFPEVIGHGEKITPVDGDGVWKWTFETFNRELESGNISFKETISSPLLDEKRNQSKFNLYNKLWLDDKDGSVPGNFIGNYENRVSSLELNKLKIPFSFAKPVGLLKYLISICNFNKNAIIMDFFSGSSSTAHAVMQLNAEDGGNRKFIMVQLPELTDEKSEAFKAGYKNLCEIGKERIRRAGEQIKQELIEKKNKAGLLDDNIVDPETFDNGFKVFKLESSNIIPWDGTIKFDESTLFSQTEVIKEDRSNLEVLYEIMLKYGVFDKPAQEVKVNGKTMYDVAKGYLIVCLDNTITLDDVKEIGKLKPRNVIFKESGFTNDNDKINATYTLEKLGVEEVKSI
jgi:adenine-specific DNA-methyltransferase